MSDKLTTAYRRLTDRLPRRRRIEAIAHIGSIIHVLTTVLLVGWAATELNGVVATLFQTIGKLPVAIASPIAVGVVLASGRAVGNYFKLSERDVSVGLLPVTGLLCVHGLRNLYLLSKVGAPESFQWGVFGLTAAGAIAVAITVYARLWRVPARVETNHIARATVIMGLVLLLAGAPIFPTVDIGAVNNAEAVGSGGFTVIGEGDYVTKISGGPDGTEEWSVNTGGRIYDIAVDRENGVVYAGHDGAPGTYIHKIDLETGNVLWTRSTDSTYSGFDLALGDDGTLYVGSSLDGTRAEAIAPDNTELWEFTNVDSNVAIGYTSGSVYAFSYQSQYELDPDTGNVVNSNAKSTTGYNTLSVGPNGNVYAAEQGGMLHKYDSDVNYLDGVTADDSETQTVVTGSNYVYAGGDSVKQFDFSLNEQWDFTGTSALAFHGVHPNSDGTLLVGDGTTDEIDEVDKSDASTINTYTPISNPAPYYVRYFSELSSGASDTVTHEFTVDDYTDDLAYQSPDELTVFRPDGSSASASFSDGTATLGGFDCSERYTLLLRDGGAYWKGEDVAVPCKSSTVTLIPGFDSGDTLGDTPTPTTATATDSEINEIQTRFERIEREYNGTTEPRYEFVFDPPEPSDQIDYNITGPNGTEYYNGSFDADGSSDYYRVEMPSNATGGVDNPQLNYEGQFATGEGFNGSIDLSGDGAIFGPVGGSSSGGSGGDPTLGIALVGGVAYLGYRRFGDGQIGQAASQAASAVSRRLGP